MTINVGLFMFYLCFNKCVGPPYSRTKIYAARMSHGSNSYRSISAAGPRDHSSKPASRHYYDVTDGRWTDGHSTVLRRLLHFMQ